jgi:hypothetical protein
MSEHGGRREGAGRPRGSRNPNTKAKREAIKAVVAQFEATTPNGTRLDVSVLTAVEQGQLLGLLRKVMSERPIAPVVSGMVRD